MRAQGGSDGANTFMTLVCDYGSRKWNDPVSLLVLLCTRMGDVTGNALYVQRCQCDACGTPYLIGGNCAAVFRNRCRTAG